MSLLITFEGVEGSGKTSQLQILNNILRLRGYETLVTREPGGTPLGDEIRKILLDATNLGMSSLCELLLYAANRAQHIMQIIEPALKGGKIVLCDRFVDATLAYQGFGRGISLDLINNVNALTIQKVKPHLTLLLDCEPKLGLKRAGERMARMEKEYREDRFENEPIDFHNRVRKGYLELARGESERIVVIDASRDIESVHQEIVGHVLKLTEKIKKGLDDTLCRS